MVEAIRSSADGQSSVYVSNVRLVATADYLASIWIWGLEEETALHEAIDMGQAIVRGLQSEKEVGVNERAYQHILDWIVANKLCFKKYTPIKRYGVFEESQAYVQIIPAVLEEELRRAGFSPRKTLQWLANQGLIDAENNDRKRYQVRRMVDGMRIRVI